MKKSVCRFLRQNGYSADKEGLLMYLWNNRLIPIYSDYPSIVLLNKQDKLHINELQKLITA